MGYLTQVANALTFKVRGKQLRDDQCLNGIAHDKDKNKTIFTGKDWPVYFVIEFK